MKIQRLMLAVLAVCGTSAAMAQSSVTVYGRVNTTIENQKVSGQNSVTGMYNNASRIGFKGVEDLGNGLKAGFILESGFDSDTGAGSAWTHGGAGGMTFARQSEVNLSGNWGMVRLGNFTPESYFATADYIGMHNHDTGTSSDAFYQDPVWFGGSQAPNLSTKNKIAYRLPTFGALTVEGAVSLHERAAAGNKNGYDLAANYAAGALALGAGYSQVGDDKQLGLRAAYTVGQFTLGGYYQRNDEALKGTRNNFRVAGMYVLGASEFHVNVGRANAWSKVDNSGALQWTLGYNYNLSKRTKVYGYFTKVDNKSGANYMTGVAGQDFRSVALGIRHNS